MRWLTSPAQAAALTAVARRVDCGTCQPRAGGVRHEGISSQNKCCDFRPFISAFSMGTWLEESPDRILPAGPRVVLTHLGLVQLAASSTDSDQLLCEFYDQGVCRIWHQRPALCRSYFCVQKSLLEQEALQSLESAWQDEEAAWLHRWYFESGGESQVWQMFVAALETPPQDLAQFPKEIILADAGQAATHYRALNRWLQERFARGEAL